MLSTSKQQFLKILSNQPSKKKKKITWTQFQMEYAVILEKKTLNDGHWDDLVALYGSTTIIHNFYTMLGTNNSNWTIY